MSLIERLGKDCKNLPNILIEYEKELEGFEAKLTIKGKNLETANAEHAGWHLYYDTRKAELYSLVKFFEGKTAAARGKLFKKYTETYNRELSDRQKDQYINNDDVYLRQLEIYLEIKEVYSKYEAVCNAFQSRGYSLNNITKIRIASLESAVI